MPPRRSSARGGRRGLSAALDGVPCGGLSPSKLLRDLLLRVQASRVRADPLAAPLRSARALARHSARTKAPTTSQAAETKATSTAPSKGGLLCQSILGGYRGHSRASRFLRTRATRTKSAGQHVTVKSFRRSKRNPNIGICP
jgi:hypothetical protein